MPCLETVSERINFNDEEEKILQKWRDENTFQTSLDMSLGRPHYTFYDGPPFATGLPHYGHILAGTIKDIVTRWAHQSGFYVERRFGWDTHGLPVEYEVDKIEGIKGPGDVHEMGIGVYNSKCRSIVMRYAAEWQYTVERMGRWIDFDNDYKTLYPWFMESVWWVFSQLYKKGLVYRGVKVMPFSTGCSTPLSNFEAGQNYKDVVDPSVFVRFPLVFCPNRSLVAWTTTPWTLPSNLALCVHPDFDYLVVSDKQNGKEVVILKERLSELYKTPDSYTLIGEVKGRDLEGLEYTPPFPYFAHLKNEGRKVFRVVTNNYVKTDAGTGIVHQSPYFGEDDFKTCLEHGVISKDSEMVCPVDDSGCFTDEVTDFKGLYVKEADKQIVADSAHLQGRPFLVYSHLLGPFFCQRQTFCELAARRKRLVCEQKSLLGHSDQSLELEQLTSVKITDLHRENIDHLQIPSKTGRGMLKRISEVFDCWFESGSMPYAQQHYPFENSEVFEHNFPADFIAEGIDQTRGWFYTLTWSQEEFSQPVGRGHEEEGVAEVSKQVLNPWFNAYKFLSTAVSIYESNGKHFELHSAGFSNVMDLWILSFTNSLIDFVRKEMKQYHLYAVVAPLEPSSAQRRLSGTTKLHVGEAETADKRRRRKFIDEVVERRVAAMRTVIEIVRTLRERKAISVKYPLKEMVIINRDQQFLDDLSSLREYILSECNVEEMVVSQDKQKYGVQLKAEPNFKILGAKLKSSLKAVTTYLKNSVTEAELEALLVTGTLTVLEHELTSEEVTVSFTVDPGKTKTSDKWETAAGSSCVVMINTAEDDNLLSRGFAREIINRVQKLRKQGKLVETDKAVAHCTVMPADSPLGLALKEHHENIQQATGTPLFMDEVPKGAVELAASNDKIKNFEVQLRLLRLEN
uniref:isoleucine--tRNA ligase n=1 Tax=Globodera rostochiensis TaxID=31243 RepID=A0A914IBR5_GLORO